MDSANPIYSGVVHGKTIALSSDPGLADGTNVRIVLVSGDRNSEWGEGIRRSAGVLSDDWSDEDDEILRQINESRHHTAFRRLPS